MNFNDYGKLIREQVKELNERDPNWKWSVRSIAKDKVCIRWGYLDYMQEKNNCFLLILTEDDVEENEVFASGRTPDNYFIDGAVISTSDTRKFWQELAENAIPHIIESIADYAHSRY